MGWGRGEGDKSWLAQDVLEVHARSTQHSTFRSAGLMPTVAAHTVRVAKAAMRYGRMLDAPGR